MISAPDATERTSRKAAATSSCRGCDADADVTITRVIIFLAKISQDGPCTSPVYRASRRTQPLQIELCSGGVEKKTWAAFLCCSACRAVGALHWLALSVCSSSPKKRRVVPEGAAIFERTADLIPTDRVGGRAGPLDVTQKQCCCVTVCRRFEYCTLDFHETEPNPKA